MCTPAFLAALPGLGGTGAATAAGATAAATTLQGIGTALAIGGSVVQGVSAYQTGKANANLIAQQRKDELQLNAVKEQRERAQFEAVIAQQRAELAARGVSLDSPTAVYLGQTAAKEMAFNSQSIRSTGQSRQSELTLAQQNWKARGSLGLMRGTMSAAGSYLTARADRWAGLEG